MVNHEWKRVLKTVVVTALATAGCSNSPSSTSQSPPTTSTTPKVVSQGSQGFASFESKLVRDVAMNYPAAEEPVVEAPFSLTADDGTGLALEALDAQAIIEGPLAFTELRMRFRNPLQRTLEGRFQITLPEGASISRLAMRMTDGWREAEVVERQAARRAYEDFLHRKQDPMLLEKESGNQFRARIFPIPAGGVKEVILSFSHELADDGNYKLPLRGLPAIDELSVTALVAEGSASATRYKQHEMKAKGTVPTKDFSVATNPELRALRHGQNIVARVRPKLTTEASRPIGVTILFDSSASRAPGFSRQVKRLGTLVGALAQAQGRAMQIHVAAFDQEVAPIYSGPAGDFGKSQLDALLARRPLGASNLGAALSWAGTQSGADRVLIIGDGVSTAGDAELGAVAKALPAAIARIDVLLVGGIRDQAAAERLVRGTRGHDGVVLRDSMADEEVARRLGAQTASVEVTVAGAEWVWPSTVAGVQDGDEFVVYAGFPKQSGAPQKLSMQLTGATLASQPETTVVPGPLLERSAINARIARLQGDYIEALGKDKETIKAKIVDISTRHRVLSDHTALLVLESESDYARFGIDRRALADILTVGAKGLVVEQRDRVVVHAPVKVPVPNARRTGFKGKMDEIARPTDGAGPGGEEEEASSEMPMNMPMEMEKKMVADPSSIQEEPVREAVALSARPSRRRPASPPVPPSDFDDDDDMEEDEDADDDDNIAQDMVGNLDSRPQPVAAVEREVPEVPEGPPALTGTMATIHELIAAKKIPEAVSEALRWRSEEAGNVMALVALGESLEAAGEYAIAARAYGSIIDLFPSRADLRRFASTRLANLPQAGAKLSVDSLRKAAKQRPDHLSVHRLLAYALVRAGDLEGALAAIEAGLSRSYPSGRFAGGLQILREDLGIIAAVILAKEPASRSRLEKRLKESGGSIASKPSTRFVLNWETDANDVDFHVYDGKGGHAFYSDRELSSGGELYADVTTGYGPECFAIKGKPNAYPYRLQIHYYSRGPMGYGMGQVEILQHDGKGGLKFDPRPFVVMNDSAYVELGALAAPL